MTIRLISSHLFAKILTSLDKFEYVWTSLALGLLYSRTKPNQKGRTESHLNEDSIKILGWLNFLWSLCNLSHPAHY